jgi:hypothetical protein
MNFDDWDHILVLLRDEAALASREADQIRAWRRSRKVAQVK